MPNAPIVGSNPAGESKTAQAVRRGWRNGAKLLAAFVLAGAIIYRMKFAPVAVISHSIVRESIAAERMGTGTLEARVRTTISPRIQERLAEMLVDQGDAVQAGQLLARLDEGELKRQVDLAEAVLASAQATVDRVRVDEARAQAVARQARQDHQRKTDLLATQVSSQAEMDKAVEQLQIAETDRARARAATLEAQQQTLTAEKNLAYQRERLGFTRILSPYDGLVTRRDRDPGSVVVPGSSLLQIVSTNEIWVSAWVDETAAAGLATGQSARVVFRSEPGKVHIGQVARLGRETDRETREFLVNIRVNTLPPNWTIGQRAEVYIETARRSEALTVPLRYLQWREGQPGVFVVDGKRAAWREVTLGLRGREAVEIMSGAMAGETVIAAAQPKAANLKPGQRIAVK
jgi:HlyD family secretion protein